jgi:hypothetical protein
MAIRCAACNRRFEDDLDNCPHCGEPFRAKPVAMLKTSTILISSNDTESVYHSVRDIPEPLRKKLLRSTSGLNARTILIADRRGQQQIARAIQSLPGASQVGSQLSGSPVRTPSKINVAHAAGILLAGATGVLAWLLLLRR